jgi:hypothetical protein
LSPLPSGSPPEAFWAVALMSQGGEEGSVNTPEKDANVIIVINPGGLEAVGVDWAWETGSAGASAELGMWAISG